jgi:hypothetical protein
MPEPWQVELYVLAMRDIMILLIFSNVQRATIVAKVVMVPN